MFGMGTDEIIGVVKKVIVAILKWIWDKIKDWFMAHWEWTAMAIMAVVIYVLVKLLLLRSALGI